MTTRIIKFLVGDPNLNLHLPLESCEGATPKIYGPPNKITMGTLSAPEARVTYCLLAFPPPFAPGVGVTQVKFEARDHQHVQVPQYLKSRNPHLYKQYGATAYIREKRNIPKIAENKVQETLHFRYLKLLVMGSVRMVCIVISGDDW